jgi:hypothetical protein
MIAIFKEMHGIYYEIQAILSFYLCYNITADSFSCTVVWIGRLIFMIILRSKENSNHCFSACKSHLFLILLTTNLQSYRTALHSTHPFLLTRI